MHFQCTKKLIVVKTLSCLFTLSLLLSGCVKTGQQISGESNKECFTTSWPHENSDLQPDPALFFGRLENGLRYVIMENREPANRVGLYLNIQAGSLQERENQRGIAHFLEHMLFNGTTHFPPGTLVQYFQSIGMSFGSDSNAHTSYGETVYNLLLPKGDRGTLTEGLLVMSDYARGALLQEAEVNRERGVILSEKRTRDSAGYRIHEKRTEFSFAGTRVAQRLPIGTEEVLRSANTEILREYYDTWYHPENMILVIVGDVDTEIARQVVNEQLGPLEGRMVGKQCEDPEKINHKGIKALALYEPDLGYTDITIETLWNTVPHVDTAAWQSERLKEYVGSKIMNNRLSRLVSQPDGPFTQASLYNGIFLQRYGYASVSAQIQSQDWSKALETLSLSVRQALEQGFFSAELERAKKEVQAQLEKEVQTATGRDSKGLAYTIIGKLNNDEVILSPQQEYDLYRPMLASITLSQVNESFRKLWENDNRLIQVTGAVEIASDKETAEQKVAEVFQLSMAGELPFYEEGDKIVFPYLPIPREYSGEVKQDDFTDIEAVRYTLDNGTILNFKKTDFKPNEVMVSVNFGDGNLNEPLPGIGSLGQNIVRESGVGAIPRDDLAAALAGKNVRVYFSVSDESFSFKGEGLNNELDLIFQLIYTYLYDPAFRPEAYQLSMDRFEQMYQQMEASVEGVMPLSGERFLAGGDFRYGMVPVNQLRRLTLDQVEKWLRPLFATEALEISVVGDIEPEEVKKLVAQYFGTTERRTAGYSKGKQIKFPAGEKYRQQVETEIDKGFLAVAWPTEDFWEISRTRRLSVLASVLSDRMRREIREKMGAVYSAFALNRSSRVDPGHGVLMAQMIVDPEAVDTIAQYVLQVADDLVSKGIEEDELRLIVGPIETSIKDMIRTNQYWLDSVLVLSNRHSEQLRWPMTLQSDFASITPEEITSLAKRYMRDADAAQIIAVPAEKKSQKKNQ